MVLNIKEDQTHCGRKFNPSTKTTNLQLSQALKDENLYIRKSLCTGALNCVNENCAFVQRFNMIDQVWGLPKKLK